MQRLFYLFANGMAAFMDFGVGCFIAAFNALWLRYSISFWEPLVAGGFFNLFPDFDILFQILWTGATGRKFEHQHHESLMHLPILVVSCVMAGGIILWALTGDMGRYWFFTATMCVIAHYLHDAVMMGKDGLGWFFRINPKYWTSRGTVEPADHDHPHWIRVNWMRGSTMAAIEVIIGSVGLGTAAGILFNNPQLAILILLVFVAGARVFWMLCTRLKYA